MQSAVKRILFLIGSFLLTAAVGCFEAPKPLAAVPETPSPTAAYTSAPTPEPTPEPTPVTVAGRQVQDGVLRAVVEENDFDAIGQLTDLRMLDVSGSTCYEAIAAYRDAHPDVTVLYTVPVGTEIVASDAEQANVSAVPDASLLTYLPALRTLTVTEPMTPAEAAAIEAAAPGAALRGEIAFAGMTVAADAAYLDLSDTSPALAPEIAEGIAVLPELTDVGLNRADGSSDWTLEQAGVLQDVRASLRVDLNVRFFGRCFSLTDDVVNLNNLDLRNRKDELRALLPRLRNVRRLDLEYCGLRDEELAALREQFPTPKIVWRVNVGIMTCRTDAIMFHYWVSNRPKLTDADVHGLVYCNEMKYLDLGHNNIQTPYFVAYMPDLEVCILAIGQPTDLSAFAHCPHLEYAELFGGSVTDVSPLANCRELKHLNLCLNQITDITPLYALTQLERLWISRNPIPQEQIDTFRKLVPDCVVNTECQDPTLNEWRWDEEHACWQERYALLRKQFMYDSGTACLSEEPPID